MISLFKGCAIRPARRPAFGISSRLPSPIDHLPSEQPINIRTSHNLVSSCSFYSYASHSLLTPHTRIEPPVRTHHPINN